MKRLFVATLVATSLLLSNNINAQCPIIVRSTFLIITDNSNPCQRQVSFDFMGTSNGLASINLTVTVSGVTVINSCIDASHAKDVQKNYTSAWFTACNMAAIEVAITPFTSGGCGGTACAETLGSTGGAPLPVLFSAFSVARNKDLVTLKWETATEINNSGFAVERNDNGSWKQVGFVLSKAMNGNSNDKLNYEFNDINYNKSMTQYRLKQLDIDGASKYSDIKAIRGTNQDATTTIFPNPATNGKVNVVFADASSRDIVLTDMAGRILNRWPAYSSNSLQVTGLTTGMFSLRILNRETGTLTSEKIMVTAK